MSKLKLEFNPSNNNHNLSSIEPGTVFKFKTGHTIYIKTNSIHDGFVQVVDHLTNFTLNSFRNSATTEVDIYDATLMLK